MARARALRRALVAAALIGLAALGPASAGHEPPRLGLTPVGEPGTYFELSMEPGEVRALQVEAANFGHAEVIGRTYVADVYSIVNGGFGATLFGQPVDGTGRWVTYPDQELALAGHETSMLAVQVQVPAGATPGEYVAALVIENVDPVRGDGAVAIDQVNRSAIAIAIDVPGLRQPGLKIGAATHQEVTGRSVVSVEVANSGNVHLRPAGDFVLSHAGGREAAAGPTSMDSVYAATATLLELPVAGLLEPGEYCVELTLRDAETRASAEAPCVALTVEGAADDDGGADDNPDTAALVAEAAKLVSPVVVAALAVAAIILILVVRRRRRRPART